MRRGGSATISSAKGITTRRKWSSGSCSPRLGARRRPAAWRRATTSGAEAAAAIRSIRSPETYIGYGRADRFVSPGGQARDAAKDYAAAPLRLNDWTLEGNWTVGRQSGRSELGRRRDRLSLSRPRPPPGAGLGKARAFPADDRRQAARRRCGRRREGRRNRRRSRASGSTSWCGRKARFATARSGSSSSIPAWRPSPSPSASARCPRSSR